MTTPYEIPLSPEPQQFKVQLGGKTYQLRFSFNVVGQHWVLDIAQQDGTPLVQGLPVVTGLSLLQQFEFLGLRGALVVQSDGDVDAVPSYVDLGSTGRLYFVTEP